MQTFFKTAAQYIASENFEALTQLPVPRPEYFNWASEIFEGIHVAEQPDATALLWTDGTQTLTYSYRQMSVEASRQLNFLRKQGVQQEDVVLTQLALQPVNWIAILSVIKGGLRLIPTATIMGVQDIVYRFQTLMPKVVIADQDNAAKIEAAEAQLGQQVPVKIIAEGTRVGWYSSADFSGESDSAETALTKAQDPLFLFFTSGTTGMPKVVIHTHLSYPLGHLTTASWIGIRSGDLHYNISQPGWAKFAWSSVFAPWNVGAAVFAYHTTERFQAKVILGLLEQYKINTFCAPPTVLRMLIAEDLTAYRFHFRQCVAAGEPLNPEIIETWQRGTGILIRDGFGQTESTCMVANLPGSRVKFGSMGKPTFLYDVVIADEEGHTMQPHEEGSICVKMNTGKPNGIFTGYLGNAEKEKQVFRHGLYYTGDKAYYDEDGYIWFVGRDDDVIKSSDYRVGPFEVESILLEHEAVLESAVVASPHAVKGSEIKAFVVLHPGVHADESLAKAVFDYCREHLAPYKLPRIIEFVTELPKTISGKIRRVELRAMEAMQKAKKVTGKDEFFYRK